MAEEKASSGSAPKQATAKSDVMLPEFQAGASSQAPADKEALAKKAAEIDKAEAAEMKAAQDDPDAEGLYGHMTRGSDR